MKRVLFAFILSSLILFGCGGKTDSKSGSFVSASVKEPLIGVVISETGEVIYDADDYSRYLAQSNVKPEPVREINNTSDQPADSAEIWTDNDVLVPYDTRIKGFRGLNRDF